MNFVFIVIVISIILIYVLSRNSSNDESGGDKKKIEDPELFSTEKFKEPENIHYAKCPQCSYVATTHEDVKARFGLRRVGYTTDIQSWCRECRRNQEEQENKTADKDLDLFKEE